MKTPTPRNVSIVLLFLVTLGSAPLARAYYDPGIQRWIHRDPISERGGINLYVYVANAPVARIDPLGLYFGGGPPPKMDDPIACAVRIKNEVWKQFGWEDPPRGGVPRPGHHPGDNNFHYGHCVASCRIQRECNGGRVTAWAAGLSKEVKDMVLKLFGEGTGFDWGDMDANREGRKRGRQCPPEQSCEQACKGTEG